MLRHIYNIKAMTLQVYWEIKGINIWRVSGFAAIGLSLQVLNNLMMPDSKKLLIIPFVVFMIIGFYLIIKHKRNEF